MGCNGSKQDDIKTDRKRVDSKKSSAAPDRGASDARSAAKPVPRGDAGKSDSESEGEQVYGTSMTQSDFIDVSQKPAGIDETDATARQIKYEKRMQETAVTRSVLGLGVNLFALPASAIPINPETKEPDAAAIAKVLSEPVSAHDIEFITQCAATIATAVDNIDVKDVGKVVLTFEEL